MKLVFKTVEIDDLEALASLSENEYGKTEQTGIQYLKWKHLENPQGKSSFFLLYDKNILIGKLGLQKRIFRKDQKDIHSWYLVDLVIHKEYRGLKTFAQLTKELKLITACDFIYVTPNSNSMLLYDKFLRLNLLFNMDVYAFPFNLKSLVNFISKKNVAIGWLSYAIKMIMLVLFKICKYISNIRLVETPHFSRAVSEGLEAFDKNILFGDRSELFLEWRFKEVLGCKYSKFLIQKESKIIGYLILQKKEYLGLNTMFVMDYILFCNVSKVDKFFIGINILYHSIIENCDLLFQFANSFASNTHFPFGIPLLRIPATFLPQATPLFVLPLSPIEVSKKDFNISCADLDVF